MRDELKSLSKNVEIFQAKSVIGGEANLTILHAMQTFSRSKTIKTAIFEERNGGNDLSCMA